MLKGEPSLSFISVEISSAYVRVFEMDASSRHVSPILFLLELLLQRVKLFFKGKSKVNSERCPQMEFPFLTKGQKDPCFSRSLALGRDQRWQTVLKLKYFWFCWSHMVERAEVSEVWVLLFFTLKENSFLQVL